MEEHGQVFGASNMMAEIVARGPIACTIGCPEALENYTGGVFNDTTGYKSPDHDIEVGRVGRVGRVGCVGHRFATREGVCVRERERERR